METLRKLTGYSGPSAHHTAAEAAVAEELEGDVLLEDTGNDSAGLGPGPGALSIRAPISADDADLGDGEGSFGSGESFDSALERMAASSTASLEAGSPIGSFHDGGSPLHEHFGHHHHHHVHHHHRGLHHDGSEGPEAVALGNGDAPVDEAQVMPVAKLTAEDELLEDDVPDDSADDNVEENGDEYEEAEGGEDALPSEDDEEVFPRVTAEGLRVRGGDDDDLPQLAPPTVGQQSSVPEEPKVFDSGKTDLQSTSVVGKEEKNLEKVLEESGALLAGQEPDSVREGELSHADVVDNKGESASQLEGSAALAPVVHDVDSPSRGSGSAPSSGVLEPASRASEDGAPPEGPTEVARPNGDANDELEEVGGELQQHLVSGKPEVTDAGRVGGESETVVEKEESLDTRPAKLEVEAVSGGLDTDSWIDGGRLVDNDGQSGTAGVVYSADSPARQNGDSFLSNEAGPSLPMHSVPSGQSLETASTMLINQAEVGAAQDVSSKDIVQKDGDNKLEGEEEKRFEDVPHSDDKEEVRPGDMAMGLHLEDDDYHHEEVAPSTDVEQPLVSESKVVNDEMAEVDSEEVMDKAGDLEKNPEKVESEAISVGEGPDSLLEEELQIADLSSSSPAVLEEEEEEDEDEDDILIERSAALAALVHAADSSSRGNGEAPSLGPARPSLPARPAGLGFSVPPLEFRGGRGAAAPARPPRPTEETQPNGEANDGHEETREKLQLIRVKFLRLAHRLGQSAHNVVVAQVLYRLGLAEQLRGGRTSGRSGSFSFDRASAIAEEQEAAGQGELDFTCTIMLLGKSGVGKSATINSIFDEVKTVTNAFSPATRKVQEVIGKVHGIQVRVIDTPGLLPSVSDQRQNEKVMSSVKRFIKKSPPDIVLYFDRLDMQSRDYGDLPLLRTITDTFGPAVWFNAIVVLTHAASAPPDGPNGLPLSYEMFVAQRSHVVQQTIRHAAGDMRLMNPVSLVENHPNCRTNRVGQRVLPNGQIWKPQLLLLCFASKILAEANSLLKLQDNAPGRPFGSRQRVPPLPFLLSSLLQSRQQLKMMDDQGGDEDESDDDLDEEDNSDDETEFDQLPPFRRLSKEEVLELDDQQRKDYFQELADRERLFQKKQWREELRRRKELKKRMAAAKEQLAEEAAEDEGARSAAVPVPLPDMVLPPSFDSDCPTHRYRYLDSPNQWLVRPVLETHGWDHDSGYDGFSVEKSFAVNNKFPAQVSGQMTKDKKETNLTMECAASFKHGEGKVTLSGLDIQTIGKDLAYTLRSETRFSNFKQNKTTGGLALTVLGETIAAGLKLENRLLVGKRLKLVVNGGALTGKGDVAYGGSLEATLRDKDYPFSRTLSTLGLSIMDWHGDLAIGGNLQSQFLLGKTMISARANLNNRGAGQISIRASSSEQLQMALIGIVPIIRAVLSSKVFGSSQLGQ